MQYYKGIYERYTIAVFTANQCRTKTTISVKLETLHYKKPKNKNMNPYSLSNSYLRTIGANSVILKSFSFTFILPLG